MVRARVCVNLDHFAYIITRRVCCFDRPRRWFMDAGEREFKRLYAPCSVKSFSRTRTLIVDVRFIYILNIRFLVRYFVHSVHCGYCSFKNRHVEKVKERYCNNHYYWVEKRTASLPKIIECFAPPVNKTAEFFFSFSFPSTVVDTRQYVCTT